ncbi:MAG: DUF6370 family protein [Limisphaerales bacterium]
MKKTLLFLFPLTALLLLAVAAPSFAAENEKAKTRTITGTGMCAKCALHEADQCQNVIQVEKAGKKVTYYLVGDVSKKFHHDNLCKDSHKVTAKGTVKKVGDKREMTVTEIKLAD